MHPSPGLGPSQDPVDLMACFSLRHSTVRPYIDSCVPFLIMSHLSQGPLKEEECSSITSVITKHYF